MNREVMAEQLREWAEQLEGRTPRDPEFRAAFLGILAGMREVAADIKRSPQLRDCPFCGGEQDKHLELRKVLRDACSFEDEGAYAHWVRCCSCGAEGPWMKSESSAVMFWNGLENRHQSPTTRYEVVPFRTKSTCGECGNQTDILRPAEPHFDARMPAFFLCDCGFVGQVGVAKLRAGKSSEPDYEETAEEEAARIADTED